MFFTLFLINGCRADVLASLVTLDALTLRIISNLHNVSTQKFEKTKEKKNNQYISKFYWFNPKNTLMGKTIDENIPKIVSITIFNKI